MQEVWRSGVDIILVIQAVHTPALDLFFNIVTLLGSEEFYLLLLPLLYWCVDKHLAQRLAYLFLFSVYTNAALKSLFRHPRPFQYDSQVLKLSVEPVRDLGYGLPSGHSQAAITVWGFLAVQAHRRWIGVLGVALMVLIPFSRVYLGVHFPTDVLAGLLIGAIWLGLYLGIEPRLKPWLARQPIGVQAGLAIIVPLILLVVSPSENAAPGVGVLIGLGIGIVIEGRTVRFSTNGALWQQTLRFFVGIVALVILREGLKSIFPGEGETLYILFRVVRYFAIGLWVALIGPWVFQRIGLANIDELRVTKA